MSILWTLHTAIVEKTIKPGTDEDKRFLALALCGEAGELANLIKKQWRGDSIDEARIAEEIGDVHAYLELLACAYGLDLDRIRQDIVLPKIKARWPEGFKANEE